MKNFEPAESEIVQLRRDLHLHPELSGAEDRTAGIVAAELEELGCRVVRAPLPGRSLLGVLETGRAGKTLALRADMDALPMDENPCNLLREKEFVSTVKGAAHMCGHDFHTAGLLGAARKISAMKDDLCGRVIFCFESAEEMGGGDDARALLKDFSPDAIWGIHVQAAYTVGTVAVLDGPCTAGCEAFKIDVAGKSAHGAMPHLGLDPINCAAQILCSANSVISRRVDSMTPAVLTVCNFHGGTTWNRIPDGCFIEGSTRFFSEQVGRDLHALLEQTAKGVAAACGCDVKISWRNLTLPSFNEAGLASKARTSVREIGAELIVGEPWMASETFSRYREICPEVLAFVGCANFEKGCGAPQHSDQFEADEDCLPIIIALTVRFVKKFLSE